VRTAAIVDAFEFARNGASIKQDSNAKGIPISRIETIWRSSIDTNRLGYANVFDSQAYEKYVLRKDDILMSHINSPKHLGKSARYKGQPEVLIHGMNLLCLRPKKDVLSPEFICHYFNTQYFKNDLFKISNQSVNQASFSVGNLKMLRVPLPPLADQKQIAEILDAADSLRQKDQQLIEHYTALSQSLFLDMFGDPVTNPKRWEKRGFLNTFDATTGKLDSNAASPAGKYPFFTCAKKALKIDSFSYDCEALLLAGNNAAGKFDVKYYNGKFDAYQRTYILSIIGTDFLYPFLRIALERKLEDLQRLSIGSSTQYLTMKILERLDFIVPPIELQNSFAERIGIIEQQKQQAQASLAKSEDLFNSLLQRAFKGELTGSKAA
jgi:type I restriction enzyme S subunit